MFHLSKYIGITVLLKLIVAVSAQRNSYNDLMTFTGATATYGDYCGSSASASSSSLSSSANLIQKCDTKALLRCNKGFCACFHPEEMIFDVIKGQCVAKAGARCKYGRDDPISLETKTQRIPCVVNGYCGADGYCQCSSMYYNSLNVTCLSQKSFDANCHFDFECRQDYNLRCVNGFCQCDPRISTRHQKYELCLGLAGESPIEGNCVEFAEKVQMALGPGSYSVCNCQDGYVKGPTTKRCHGTISHACTPQSPCQHKLSCIQGTCQCDFPEYQRYDIKSNKCLSNAFGPCKISSDCIPEAFCNRTGIYKQCECKSGYIIGSSSSICEKSIGTKCQILPIHRRMNNNNDEPPVNHKLPRTKFIRAGYADECSQDAGLQCRNGICKCPDLQVFSQELEKCVGLVGSVCKKSKETSELPVCIKDSQCLYKTERSDFGLCSCLDGFFVTPSRECEATPVVLTTTLRPTPRRSSKPPKTSTNATFVSSEEEIEVEEEEEETDEMVQPTLVTNLESELDNNVESGNNVSFHTSQTPDLTTTGSSDHELSANETAELAAEFEKILYGKFDNSTFIKILNAFNKVKDGTKSG